LKQALFVLPFFASVDASASLSVDWPCCHPLSVDKTLLFSTACRRLISIGKANKI